MLRWGIAAVWVLSATIAPLTGSAQESPDDQDAAAQETDTSAQQEHRGFGIELGLLAVDRSMRLDVDAESIEHDPQPYLGAHVRTHLELTELGDPSTVLRLDGEFAYGVARNAQADPEIGRPLVTQLSMGGGRLGIARSVADQWSVYVGLGAHVTSFIIEANRSYTGHRYVAGEAALALGWLGTSVPLAVDLEMAALPVLDLNQSSGGFGDGRAFGARAGAGLGWNVLERDVSSGYAGARVSLRYRYQRFRSVFPQRRIALGGGTSLDQKHAAMLMFGYFL